MMSEILFALYFIQSGESSRERERESQEKRETALIPLLERALF